MKSEKGISLITLIIIIAIVVIGIIFIVSSNQDKMVRIKWGSMPSTEYYELKLAATKSEVSGAGSGTLSQASFNTLGRDVKNAGGKWFKNSNVNFKASVLDKDGTGMEIITLTDGKHTATFSFSESFDYVFYTFKKEDHKGYKITIK